MLKTKKQKKKRDSTTTNKAKQKQRRTAKTNTSPWERYHQVSLAGVARCGVGTPGLTMV